MTCKSTDDSKAVALPIRASSTGSMQATSLELPAQLTGSMQVASLGLPAQLTGSSHPRLESLCSRAILASYITLGKGFVSLVNFSFLGLVGFVYFLSLKIFLPSSSLQEGVF